MSKVAEMSLLLVGFREVCRAMGQLSRAGAAAGYKSSLGAVTGG